MKKVNFDVIKPWIARRINEILGIEDDVVIEYVFSQLEDEVRDVQGRRPGGEGGGATSVFSPSEILGTNFCLDILLVKSENSHDNVIRFLFHYSELKLQSRTQ